MQANKKLRDSLVEAIDRVLGTKEPRFKVFESEFFTDVRDLSRTSNQTVARFWDLDDEAYKYAARRNKEDE